MKALTKTLIFTMLLAMTCSAAAFVAFAAEDVPDTFAGDEEMIGYAPMAEPGAYAEPGTTMRATQDDTQVEGDRAFYNIENAPALRTDNEVLIPQVELQPEENEQEVTPYTPAPDTGYASSAAGVAGAVVLLAGAVLLARKNKADRLL